jgi:3-oxoacyl-[acyl-carrier-protein] synthase III
VGDDVSARRCRLESVGISPPRRGLLRWGSVKHAVVAGRRCLAASRYHPADVRVLINTGVHRDGHVCEPAIAAYIQHGLGINIEFQGRRTLAFDLLNGGCGMLSALHVLSALLLSGQADVGMVVSSEANSDRRPDPGYTYPPSGAALMLDISPLARQGFGSFAFHTDEARADLYTSVVSLKEKRGRLILRRDDALEGAYLDGVAPVVEQLLAAEGLRREELDLVVPAQISPRLVSRLPQTLGVAPERVVDLTRRLADTHSTSLFLALDEVRTTRPPPEGSKLLLLAFGAGVTVGGAIYRC